MKSAACALAFLVLCEPAQGAEWESARLYRNTWSAERMLDTPVRDARAREVGEVNDIIVGIDGRIHRIVVEVGGIAEAGDQHVSVPWGDVNVGPHLQWIGTPLEEIRDGMFALHGAVPQGEHVAQPPGSWRVSERMGRAIAAEGQPRGVVADVIFDDSGRARGLVVDRGAEAGEARRFGWIPLQ